VGRLRLVLEAENFQLARKKRVLQERQILEKVSEEVPKMENK
jgi:hypothetical protein